MQEADHGNEHTKVPLGQITYIDIRNVWEHEARNFTPWLLDNSDHLADALGIDLFLDEREHAVGTFKLDILGRDQTHSCPLIVENQLEETNHDHLGKLLTYAAGTQARTVVWIAKNFRDEHRDAVEFLNEVSVEDARFFAIEILAAKIGDSPPAPLLRVVAQPSNWQAQLKGAKSGQGGEGGRGALYFEFWSQYLNKLHEQHPGTSKVRSPSRQNWLNLNYQRPLTFAAVFLRGGKLSYEVYIDVGNADSNLEILEALAQHRAEVEATIGSALDWQHLENKQACRIRLERDGAIGDREKWPEMQDWIFNQQDNFKKAFYPLTSSLPS